jgi:hypothetical protein
MSEMNDHGAIPQGPSIAEVRAWMTTFINPIMIGAVNGVLRSMPQIPVDEVMVMVCGLFGRTVGATLSIGELGPILGLRKRCKDAFIEEMGKVSVRPMPGPPQSEVELVNKLKPSA